MALSIFTNTSAMSATNILNKSNVSLATSMDRLGTGKRINTAADDAAGLQIATRLTAQSNGMKVALRNVSDATAMLQTAEGAFDEVGNILYRLKDLATQAANGTNSEKDIEALQSEFKELGAELTNIMTNTSYSGEDLFGETKLGAEVKFQIGASEGELLTLDVSAQLNETKEELNGYATGEGLASQDAANKMITTLTASLDKVSSLRATLGASINRLGHTAANLTNMKDNTDVAIGTIMDADFALEAASMTRNQMLAQTSMTMLKQANSMPSMIMSLLG